MVTIYKAMMAAVEDYIGTIETSSLQKYEPGKPYTSDRIQINGVTGEGREFSLELTMEGKERDS